MMLDRLDRLVNYCREQINAEMPIQHLKVLLCVAENHPEGITQHDLAEEVEMSSPVISRTCKALGQYGQVNRDGSKEIRGADLMYTAPDLFEKRRMRVKLTPKGVEVVAVMDKILQGKNYK